jgi:TetR/AcrR family transcriptional regulator, lmrAB and yxaGH operons repressor
MAGAPKGSLYHHYPGGKEEIAIAAVQAISHDILALLQRFEENHIRVADMVREIGAGGARWLKASRWREATMLSATATGAIPDLPRLHAAIQEAFDQWRKRLTRLLIAEGWQPLKARRMAETVMAATEGAMIMARVDQNERVVRSVAEMLGHMIEKESSVHAQIE